MSFLDTLGRVGFGLATGGLSELPGLVDKYVTKGSEAAGKSAAAQRSAMDQAMKRLQESSAQQYQNRQADLKQIMGFYGPAQRYLENIYGPGPGPGASAAPTPSGFGAGPPAQPPGFPKMPAQGPMGFGQGPRRGF
jgi:hypothetical protein